MGLPSLTEHGLLLMWVQLLVILVVARALGSLMQRIGQPRVIGELLAGVLLGPSVLAHLWPAAERFLVPHSLASAAPINAIGWIGVAFLLVLTGFETDLTLVRKLGRPATFVAVGGLAVPFAAGLAVGFWMPSSLMGEHSTATAFVLFIAVSLSISSLPVIAKILSELGLMRRDFAQVTVAVGMVNDLVGWLALGIIAALGRTSHVTFGTIAYPLAAIAVILAIAIFVGQRGVDAVLRLVRKRDRTGADAMGMTLLITFLFAVATQLARSDAVLGAYIAGILIGRSRFFQERTRRQLQSVNAAIFAPVFFATAGLRVNLASLADPTTLAWAGIILAVAVGSKFGGAFGAARLARLGGRESLALAVGLNARGAVEVVIATVGLTIGVLSGSVYTAIVVMAIVTSMMAPPLLRLIVRGWQGSAEERLRLQREAAMESNLLIRRGRLLMPTRGGPNSLAVARVLHDAWPPESPVTLLAIGTDAGKRPDLREILQVFENRDVEVRQVRGAALDATLAEARLGYVALGLGSRDSFREGRILNPVVDDLLSISPVPMVIVRGGRGDSRPAAGEPFRKVLVPVTGSTGSRAAQEFGYGIAQRTGADLVLAHIVTQPERDSGREVSAEAPSARQAEAASQAAVSVVREALSHAREQNVPARGRVRAGRVRGEEILAEAEATGADLIVLGTFVSTVDGRPFLGYTVDHVLAQSTATVVVVAIPEVLPVIGVTERNS
ncbi:MAG TPA: cation:proton antiporter [Microbacteriaceae bacterium]|nr:cation:proton antiporter [Microbacteriaceae bacterium]